MFRRGQKQSNKSKKWLLEMILAHFLYKIIKNFFFKNEKNIEVNLKDFLKKEEKEVRKLVHHKESFRKYCHDSTNIFQDYFIPCACNDHRPKILRRKSLLIITLSLIFIKVFTVFYLFFIYPNDAKMSEFIASKTVVLMNEDRVASGLSALKTNEYLNSVAQAKAEDMIMNNYFAHKSVNGNMPWDWINKETYEYLYVGENLAMNFTSAESAHKALMLSPTHKKNIMNDKYAEIGIAVVSGEINGEVTNVMVEIFASKKPQTVLAVVPPSQTAGSTKIIEESSLVENKTTEVAGVQNEKIIEKITAPEIIEEVIEEKTLVSLNGKEQLLPSEVDKNISDSKEIIIKIDQPANEEVSPLVEKKIDEIVITEAVADEKIARESVVMLKEFENPVQNILPKEATVYKNLNTAENSNVSFVLKIIKYSKVFLYASLLLLFVSLLINIFVRATIQHQPIIVESLMSIAIIGALIFTRIHLLENILDSVLII